MLRRKFGWSFSAIEPVGSFLTVDLFTDALGRPQRPGIRPGLLSAVLLCFYSCTCNTVAGQVVKFMGWWGCVFIWWQLSWQPRCLWRKLHAGFDEPKNSVRLLHLAVQCGVDTVPNIWESNQSLMPHLAVSVSGLSCGVRGMNFVQEREKSSPGLWTLRNRGYSSSNQVQISCSSIMDQILKK